MEIRIYYTRRKVFASKKYYFAQISFHTSQIKCVLPGIPANLDTNLTLMGFLYRDWMLLAFPLPYSGSTAHRQYVKYLTTRWITGIARFYDQLEHF